MVSLILRQLYSSGQETGWAPEQVLTHQRKEEAIEKNNKPKLGEELMSMYVLPKTDRRLAKSDNSHVKPPPELKSMEDVSTSKALFLPSTLLVLATE
jgi:hypothetical protein